MANALRVVALVAFLVLGGLASGADGLPSEEDVKSLFAPVLLTGFDAGLLGQPRESRELFKKHLEKLPPRFRQDIERAGCARRGSVSYAVYSWYLTLAQEEDRLRNLGDAASVAQTNKLAERRRAIISLAAELVKKTLTDPDLRDSHWTAIGTLENLADARHDTVKLKLDDEVTYSPTGPFAAAASAMVKRIDESFGSRLGVSPYAHVRILRQIPEAAGPAVIEHLQRTCTVEVSDREIELYARVFREYIVPFGKYPVPARLLDRTIDNAAAGKGDPIPSYGLENLRRLMRQARIPTQQGF